MEEGLSKHILWQIVFITFPITLLILWIFSPVLGVAKPVIGVLLLVLFLMVWAYGFLWIIFQKESLGVQRVILLTLACAMFSVIFSTYVYWKLGASGVQERG